MASKSTYFGQYNVAFLSSEDDNVLATYSRPSCTAWTSAEPVTLPLVATSTPLWCPTLTERPEPQAEPRVLASSGQACFEDSTALRGARCLNRFTNPSDSAPFVAAYLEFSSITALQSFCVYEGINLVQGFAKSLFESGVETFSPEDIAAIINHRPRNAYLLQELKHIETDCTYQPVLLNQNLDVDLQDNTHHTINIKATCMAYVFRLLAHMHSSYPLTDHGKRFQLRDGTGIHKPEHEPLYYLGYDIEDWNRAWVLFRYTLHLRDHPWLLYTRPVDAPLECVKYTPLSATLELFVVETFDSGKSLSSEVGMAFAPLFAALVTAKNEVCQGSSPALRILSDLRSGKLALTELGAIKSTLDILLRAHCAYARATRPIKARLDRDLWPQVSLALREGIAPLSGRVPGRAWLEQPTLLRGDRTVQTLYLHHKASLNEKLTTITDTLLNYLQGIDDGTGIDLCNPLIQMMCMLSNDMWDHSFLFAGRSDLRDPLRALSQSQISALEAAASGSQVCTWNQRPSIQRLLRLASQDQGGVLFRQSIHAPYGFAPILDRFGMMVWALARSPTMFYAIDEIMANLSSTTLVIVHSQYTMMGFVSILQILGLSVISYGPHMVEEERLEVMHLLRNEDRRPHVLVMDGSMSLDEPMFIDTACHRGIVLNFSGATTFMPRIWQSSTRGGPCINHWSIMMQNGGYDHILERKTHLFYAASYRTSNLMPDGIPDHLREVVSFELAKLTLGSEHNLLPWHKFAKELKEIREWGDVWLERYATAYSLLASILLQQPSAEPCILSQYSPEEINLLTMLWETSHDDYKQVDLDVAQNMTLDRFQRDLATLRDMVSQSSLRCVYQQLRRKLRKAHPDEASTRACNWSLDLEWEVLGQEMDQGSESDEVDDSSPQEIQGTEEIDMSDRDEDQGSESDEVDDSPPQEIQGTKEIDMSGRDEDQGSESDEFGDYSPPQEIQSTEEIDNDNWDVPLPMGRSSTIGEQHKNEMGTALPRKRGAVPSDTPPRKRSRKPATSISTSTGQDCAANEPSNEGSNDQSVFILVTEPVPLPSKRCFPLTGPY